MKIIEGLKYTMTHEWIKVNGDEAEVGLTDYAQQHLGAIVFVDLPNVGDSFKKGEEFSAVESTKAASDVYLPVSGEISAVNEALEDEPGLINSDCYKNYIAKIKISNPKELDDLLDAKSYALIANK